MDSHLACLALPGNPKFLQQEPSIRLLFRFFLSGTDDGSVRFWRLETGAGESFRTHENTVSALAAHKDRQGSLILASACFEGTITIWRAGVKDGLKQDKVVKRSLPSYVGSVRSIVGWSGFCRSLSCDSPSAMVTSGVKHAR